MPARPHRTVDRVIEILETVSLSPRGVTLAELATALDAAKSSVQELTNGLWGASRPAGYLIESETASPRLTYLYEAHVVPLAAGLLAPVKTLVDRGVLTEVDIRSLHFVIAPRSGRAVQHGALRQDAQPRWTPWTPTPCASMRAWSPT